MDPTKITSYSEFWPYYLAQHSDPWTKRFHIAGTFLAFAVIIGCVASGNWMWSPLALLAGYGPAWISHFFIEKNKPATFGHPVWSFFSDFRMFYLWLTGKL